MAFKLRIYKFFMKIVAGFVAIINLFRIYKIGGKAITNITYGEYKSKKFKYDLLVNENAQRDKGIIIFFHGGGFISGDKRIYHKACGDMASKGYVVINVNYPLAPKAGLSEIVDMCKLSITKSIERLRRTIEIPEKVVLAGDSAGAFIATKIAKDWEISADAPIKISGLMGFYGVYNLETFKNQKFPAKDLFLYALFGKDYKSEKLENLMENMGNKMPKTLLISGQTDSLHAGQSAEFAENLKANDADVTTYFFDKDDKSAKHGFLGYPNNRSENVIPEIVDNFIKSII